MNFDTTKNYVLENERVLLRPLLIEDRKHLLNFSLNEPEIWNYSLIPANGEKNLDHYLAIAHSKKEQKDSYPFIVFDKKVNAYAGSTRFYDIQPEHNTVQLGYTWYGKDFQRTGLNQNCKYLLLEFAFETMGVERVEFRADAQNARSITAMKNIGCTVEGILRSNCAGPTSRRDSIILSILKNEWHDAIKASLFQKI
ncbi:MAG: GNAT family protein [Bacteroidota bacterium]